MSSIRLVTFTCEELTGNMDMLLRVYQNAYRELPEYGYHHPDRIRGYLLWLWRGDPAGFLVAVDGERIAGFISIHGDWKEGEELVGEIHEFVVDPEYQGKGVGDLLFDSALRYAVLRGRKKVGLWVGEKNERALEFYRRRGFEKKEQWGKWIRMVRGNLP